MNKLLIFLLLFLVLFNTRAVSQDTNHSLNKAEEQFKHAQTFYWYGRYKENSLYEFRKAANYLTAAKTHLNAIDERDTSVYAVVKKMKLEINLLEQNISDMEAICIENLNGRYPLLYQISGRSGDFEYWDDPKELALEDAIKNLLEIPLPTKPLSEQMLPVIVLSEPENGFMEEVASQYITNHSNQLVIQKYKLLDFIQPDELNEFKEPMESIHLLEKISKGLAYQKIAVYTINFEDQVDGISFWSVNYTNFIADSGLTPAVEAHGFKVDKRQIIYKALLMSVFMIILLTSFFFVLILLYRKISKSAQASAFTHQQKVRTVGHFIFSLFSGIIIIVVMLFIIRALLPPSDEFFGSMKAILRWKILVPFIFTAVPIILNYLFALKISGKEIHRQENLTGVITGSTLSFLVTIFLLSIIRNENAFLSTQFIFAVILLNVAGFLITYVYRQYFLQKKNFFLLPLIILFIFLFQVSSILLIDPELITQSLTHLIITAVIFLLSLIFILFIRLDFWKKENSKNKKEKPEAIKSVQSIEDFRSILENPVEYIYPYKKGKEYRPEEMANDLFNPDQAGFELYFTEGVRGIGQTRQMQMLKSYLEGQNDTLVFYGDCDEFQDSNTIPYEPFVEALGEHIGHGAFTDQGQKVGTVFDAIKKVEIGPIPAIAAFLGQSDTDSDGANVDEVVNEILKVFRKLSAKGTRTLLIIEDIHWIDKESTELLRLLLRNFLTNKDAYRNIRLLITSCETGEENCNLKRIEEILNIKEYKLDNLNQYEYENYFRRFLNAHKINLNYYTLQKLEEYFGSVNLKVPLHFHQTLINIIDRGWIHYRQGEIVLSADADFDELPPPDNLEKIFQQKFKKLDPEILKLLISASYIGMSFEAKILGSVWWGVENVENKILDLFHKLQEAEKLGIIIDKSDQDDIYEFASKGVMAALRTFSKFNTESTGKKLQTKGVNIPQTVREYHKRIIAAIEYRKANSLKVDINLLCSVAKRSRYLDLHDKRNIERIIKYNSLAGERCFRAGRMQEALDYSEYVWDIYKQDLEEIESNEKKELILRLMQIYRAINNIPKALTIQEDELFKSTGLEVEYLNNRIDIIHRSELTRSEKVKQMESLLANLNKKDLEHLPAVIKYRAYFHKILFDFHQLQLNKVKPIKQNEQFSAKFEYLIDEIETNETEKPEIINLKGEILNFWANLLIRTGSAKAIELLDKRTGSIYNEPTPFTDQERKRIFEDKEKYNTLSFKQKEDLKYNVGAYFRYYLEINSEKDVDFFFTHTLRINKDLTDSFGVALNYYIMAEYLIEKYTDPDKNTCERIFNYYYEAYYSDINTQLNSEFYGKLIDTLNDMNKKGVLNAEEKIKHIENDYKNN